MSDFDSATKAAQALFHTLLDRPDFELSKRLAMRNVDNASIGAIQHTAPAVLNPSQNEIG